MSQQLKLSPDILLEIQQMLAIYSVHFSERTTLSEQRSCKELRKSVKSTIECMVRNFEEIVCFHQISVCIERS